MNASFYDHEKVKKLRQQSGITQQDLAIAIKKDRVTVARLETGFAASLELLIDYTAFFNQDYRDFLLPTPESVTKKFLAVV